MFWHKVRGHAIKAFKCRDEFHPWRWQCSCGRIFGGAKQ